MFVCFGHFSLHSISAGQIQFQGLLTSVSGSLGRSEHSTDLTKDFSIRNNFLNNLNYTVDKLFVFRRIQSWD